MMFIQPHLKRILIRDSRVGGVGGWCDAVGVDRNNQTLNVEFIDMICPLIVNHSTFPFLSAYPPSAALRIAGDGCP